MDVIKLLGGPMDGATAGAERFNQGFLVGYCSGKWANCGQGRDVQRTWVHGWDFKPGTDSLRVCYELNGDVATYTPLGVVRGDCG